MGARLCQDGCRLKQPSFFPLVNSSLFLPKPARLLFEQAHPIMVDITVGQVAGIIAALIVAGMSNSLAPETHFVL